MVEWEHEARCDGAETATGLLGRQRLFLIDWKRSDEPVQWFVRREGIFFGSTEGRARTMDEGKAQAIAAAEAETAQDAAWTAAMDARKAES